MDDFGQLDLNDFRPRALAEDELDRRRRLARHAEDSAWTLIADAAETGLNLPGLSCDAVADLRDLLLAARSAAGQPAVRLLQPAVQAG